MLIPIPTIILFITSLLHILIGWLIFRSNKKGKTNLAFFLFAVTLSIWTFLQGASYSVSPENTLLFVKLTTTAAFFFPCLFLYLGFIFPYSIQKPTRVFFLFHGVCILIFFSFLKSKNYIYLAEKYPGQIILKTGYLFDILNIYILITIFYGIFILIKKYRATEDPYKSQILFVFSGALISIGIGAIFSMLLPFIGYPQYNFFSPAGTIFLVGLWGIAILKLRMMEIRIAIGKIPSYIGLIAVAVFSLLFLENILSYFPRVNKEIALGVLCVIWAVGGDFIREKIILTGLRHAFVKGRYDQGDMLKALYEKAIVFEDKDKIIKGAISVFDKSLGLNRSGAIFQVRNSYKRTEGYKLIITPPNKKEIEHDIQTYDPFVKYFDEIRPIHFVKDLESSIQEKFVQWGFDEKAVILPLYSFEGFEGLLLLGPRGSGVDINENDIEFFKTVTRHLCVAMNTLTTEELILQKINFLDVMEDLLVNKFGFLMHSSGFLKENFQEYTAWMNGLLDQNQIKLNKKELGHTSKLKGKVYGELQVIDNGVEYFIKLINKIVDLTKLQSNSIEGHKQEEKIKLSEFLNDFIDEMKNEVGYTGKKAIKFEAKYSNNIENNTYQINKEILLKMLAYLSENPIFLKGVNEITYDVKEALPNKLRFTILDNIGVPDSKLKEIVKSYMQSAEEMQRFQKGMDLGLLTTRLFLKLINETLQIGKDQYGRSYLYFDFPAKMVL